MIEEDAEPELVAAARSMEQNPFMDARIDKEMFRLIRRHAPELRTRFAQNLGYRLVVEAGFARLLKPPMPWVPPDRGSATRRAACEPARLPIHLPDRSVPASTRHGGTDADLAAVRAASRESPPRRRRLLRDGYTTARIRRRDARHDRLGFHLGDGRDRVRLG